MNHTSNLLKYGLVHDDKIVFQDVFVYIAAFLKTELNRSERFSTGELVAC
jgi:hypothetical protein